MCEGAALPERSRAFVLSVLGILAAVLAPLALAGVQYTYDMLGRIAQAIYDDGSIVEYRYDANGNIVAINRLNAGSLSIATFSPVIGQAGTVVTILGSGFSPTPSENTVTFGTANGVVSSAPSHTTMRVGSSHPHPAAARRPTRTTGLASA